MWAEMLRSSRSYKFIFLSCVRGLHPVWGGVRHCPFGTFYHLTGATRLVLVPHHTSAPITYSSSRQRRINGENHELQYKPRLGLHIRLSIRRCNLRSRRSTVDLHCQPQKEIRSLLPNFFDESRGWILINVVLLEFLVRLLGLPQEAKLFKQPCLLFLKAVLFLTSYSLEYWLIDGQFLTERFCGLRC